MSHLFTNRTAGVTVAVIECSDRFLLVAGGSPDPARRVSLQVRGGRTDSGEDLSDVQVL